VRCGAVSQSLNVILLQKKLRNAPDLSIYSLLIRKVSGLSPRQLVEAALPWVRTMDQDVSNSNASQGEPHDPHQMRIGRLENGHILHSSSFKTGIGPMQFGERRFLNLELPNGPSLRRTIRITYDKEAAGAHKL
jgi:hypothetical protein